jgi:2-polyprenyl-3-methyl-5-hydroxy-6-metoxy-1,4-benzoquinol methylase
MTMPGLHEIYDNAFFEEWGRLNQPYMDSAVVIADELFRVFAPARMIDLGCGCGVYSHLFAEKGVDVVAVDGVQPSARFAFDIPIELRDLTVPFDNPWGAFDLAFCVDVGEHIPESMRDTFLANITQFSDRLLLACAPQGQRGHHHVNEQPKRYWVRHLAEHGMIYNKTETGKLCEAFKVLRPPLMWMWEHISVYERRQ